MSDEIAKLIHERYKDRIICIASPLPEQTDYRFNISLIEFITQNINLFQMRLHHAVSSRIAVNRNNIVKAARQMGCTDILWIDGDTKFPVNGLLTLLGHNKDIVCATTCMRKEDGIPVGTQMDVGVQERLIRMKLIGMPFMLTKMGVFDKMKEPYFAEPPRWAFSEIDTVSDEVIGEDEYFCYFAIKSGFDIWCDMRLSVEIGHIGTKVHYISPNNVLFPPPVVDEAIL